MFTSKGETEQFNWIFVLVAGGIFFSFFVLFTFRYIHLQDEKQNLALSKILESDAIALASAGNDLDTVLQFPQPATLTTTCFANKTSLSINTQDTPRVLDSSVLLFAPPVTSNLRLSAWTNQWYQPYYLGNFLFLSNPETHFSLLYESQYQSLVESLRFSSSSKIERHALPTIPTLSSGSTVVLFMQSSPSVSFLNQFQNVTLLVVSPDQHKVSFPLENNSAFVYSHPSLLIGAIVSGSGHQFSCQAQRASSRFATVNQFYTAKANLLQQKVQGCSYTALSTALQSYPAQLSRQPALEQQLTTMNSNLLGNGCPGVF